MENDGFRKIPEFSQYEINKDGDLRNRNTGKFLTESFNGKSWHYNLWHEGKTRSRSGYGLIRAAWPEIANLPSKWRTIPGYPNYQMDKDGNIRNVKQSKFIRVWTGRGQLAPSVRLYKNHEYHWFILEDLKSQVWPVESEEENAA